MSKIDVYDVNSSEGLEDYELKDIRTALGSDPELIVINYVSEQYEGYGSMVVLHDGKWYHHDMGHCSCYGPCEHFSAGDPSDSLPDLLASCSGDLYGEMDKVIAKLKELGYDTT